MLCCPPSSGCKWKRAFLRKTRFYSFLGFIFDPLLNLLVSVCVEQNSDAGGDDTVLPVENEAFMDDSFAQVCPFTSVRLLLTFLTDVICCVPSSLTLCVCLRLRTSVPASTRSTRASQKSKDSTPPSCRRPRLTRVKCLRHTHTEKDRHKSFRLLGLGSSHLVLYLTFRNTR